MNLPLPHQLRLLATKLPNLLDSELVLTAADILEHMTRQIELNKLLDEDDLK